MKILALSFLSLITAVSGFAEEVVFQSYFEDDRHHLEGWGLQGEPREDVVLEVRGKTGTDWGMYLKVETPQIPEPVRIVQKTALFPLRPGNSYILSAVVRVQEASTRPGGRVRIFVTNARWTWSSDSIPLETVHPDWEKLSVSFTIPDDSPENQNGRIRIEILNARTDFDIASLTVTQTN